MRVGSGRADDGTLYSPRHFHFPVARSECLFFIMLGWLLVLMLVTCVRYFLFGPLTIDNA